MVLLRRPLTFGLGPISLALLDSPRKSQDSAVREGPSRLQVRAVSPAAGGPNDDGGLTGCSFGRRDRPLSRRLLARSVRE